MSHQERKRKEHLRRQRAVEQAVASRERPLVEARDALAREIVQLRQRNAELECEVEAGRAAVANVDRAVAEAVAAARAEAAMVAERVQGTLSRIEQTAVQQADEAAQAKAKLMLEISDLLAQCRRDQETIQRLRDEAGRDEATITSLRAQLAEVRPELERLRHEDRDAAKLRRRLHAATQENGVLNGKWAHLKQVVIAMIRENGRSFVPARFDRGYYASLMAEVYAEVDKQREETTEGANAER